MHAFVDKQAKVAGIGETTTGLNTFSHAQPVQENFRAAKFIENVPVAANHQE